jgi:hypothetical protein
MLPNCHLVEPLEDGRPMDTIVYPETVISPDIRVMLKILSSEYRLYACGKIFRMP